MIYDCISIIYHILEKVYLHKKIVLSGLYEGVQKYSKLKNRLELLIFLTNFLSTRVEI